MAITTQDQVAAGMQPAQVFTKQGLLVPSTFRAYSFWGIGGRPAAGSYDTTLAGVTLSSGAVQLTGQIPFNPPSGGIRAYIGRVSVAATFPTLVMIADRLWHNGGMSATSTSAQTINSPTLPPRDRAGTSNGDGVFCMIEGSTAMGAGTPTVTLGYTNQDNVSGRTANAVHTVDSTNQGGPAFMIGLQSGDTGIRSIQTYTQSATRTSGTQHLVLYRPLAYIPVRVANVRHVVEFSAGEAAELFPGTVPFLIAVNPSAGSIAVTGSIEYTFG